jgi:hypothetical protein
MKTFTALEAKYPVKYSNFNNAINLYELKLEINFFVLHFQLITQFPMNTDKHPDFRHSDTDVIIIIIKKKY